MARSMFDSYTLYRYSQNHIGRTRKIARRLLCDIQLIG